MSVEFYGEPPGKFDLRTLNRKTLNRWTGRKGCFGNLEELVWATRWFGQGQHTPRRLKLITLLDLCMSSLRRGHANILCIVPILTDDPRSESGVCANCWFRLGPTYSMAIPLTARCCLKVGSGARYAQNARRCYLWKDQSASLPTVFIYLYVCVCICMYIYIYTHTHT